MAFELAIVGMDCRFPKSKDLGEYWENLRNGVDCASVLDTAGIAATGLEESYVKSANFVGVAYGLQDIGEFDAAFFGIAALQAMVMSPQHRLLLESAWNALEYAGYNPRGCGDDVGVFVGSDDNTYYLGLRDNPRVAQLGAQRLLPQGNYLAYLPAWVSYKLNLKGPSLGIHTGCSSSLAAVHLACNSLLLGECRIALAGAVAARIPQRGYYHYEAGGLESADGRCRPFDAGASGAVFGNGVGTIVIKRLSDALADRDTVHAVIKGSAVNNDGGLKTSFTAPNGASWTTVIAEALANSDVHPESIGYVEAHGTGTPVGDAMEIEAMTKAFRKHTDKRSYCAVGSAKGNVGHLDAAAGMTGLIKTICILKHGLIPPTVHFSSPNPRIDFADTPFFVNRTLIPWPNAATPRRAAVSAFGIGGANAHVVVEEAPVVIEQPAENSAGHLLLLSAKTPSALRNAVENLLRHLQSNPSLRIADVAYTLQLGRESFDHRCAVVCRSLVEAIEELQRLLQRLSPSVAEPDQEHARPKQAIFVIAGISATTLELSRGLYAASCVFRRAFDECVVAIKLLFGGDLDCYRLVYGEIESGSKSAGGYADELASFVIQYAVTTVWMSMGVSPAAMMARGVGRYVVAVLCGTMQIETALKLVVFSVDEQRGKHSGADGTALAKLDAQARLIRGQPLQAPRIPYLSERTGNWIAVEEAIDMDYWLHGQAGPPLAAGLERELQEHDYRLVEVGLAPLPDAALAVPTTLRERLLRLPHPRQDAADSSWIALLNIFVCLWENAVELRKEALAQHAVGRRIPLPTYPFERKHYWIEPQQANVSASTVEHESEVRDDAPEHSGTEYRLLQICRQLLRLPGMDPMENVFDLGANSLQINQLRVRIREFMGVDVSLQTLFEYPSVRSLSTQIELAGARSGNARDLAPGGVLKET